MPLSRRLFLQQSATLLAAGSAAAQPPADAALPIIDTHQHLWDRNAFRLPWLEQASEVLRRNYSPADYREATRGLEILRTVYMEVDVDPTQKLAEAQFIAQRQMKQSVTPLSAVVGGDPSGPGFSEYVRQIRALGPVIKGVRQVLHNASLRQGYCLQEAFVRGVRLLGEHGLRFDLCMRPTELSDGRRLSEECPDTQFILDHCGNADVAAFRRGGAGQGASHQADVWRRDIDTLARRPNIACKISGIIARAPRGWAADDLAPIVNHCLDTFGPDRVVFGSDWPVCLLGASLRAWVDALRQVVARRPLADRRKLWSENARRIYRLDA